MDVAECIPDTQSIHLEVKACPCIASGEAVADGTSVSHEPSLDEAEADAELMIFSPAIAQPNGAAVRMCSLRQTTRSAATGSTVSNKARWPGRFSAERVTAAHSLAIADENAGFNAPPFPSCSRSDFARYYYWDSALYSLGLGAARTSFTPRLRISQVHAYVLRVSCIPSVRSCSFTMCSTSDA